ncbi:OLC1v1021919C1 [Oldenlandia corymbosa var. corymbosa]|uniref:OLC1v1021919C1 n=1 Tax=Oldenlandia corymbosa var. corymbosa TaxID=529605 RepID=A0AAV1C888_OLDCO|nr:OLC1v1021919C1 [Oldenlandia corymbosa var. corymbosa]
MERRRGIRSRQTTNISDTSVNNNGVCSSETGVMRKPLSDVINNLDIIPTQTLRKIVCSNTISPSEAQSILRKSQVLNPRFPQFPPIPKAHVVPDSDSRSATSIGSSNFNPAPITQPKQPVPVTRPPSSSKGLKPTGDKVKETIIFSHARSVENLKGLGKTDVSPHNAMVSEKMKGQGKTTSIFTPSEKAKDKGKGISVPSDSTPAVNERDKPPEKAKDKGKGIASQFYSTPTGNVRDRPPEKLKDKGKGIAMLLDSVPARNVRSRPPENAKDKGKGIATLLDSVPSRNVRSRPPENAKDKGKGIATTFDSGPTGNVRDKQERSSVHFSSPIVERTFDKGKSVYVPCISTVGVKRKDKGKAIANEVLEDVEESTPLIAYSRSSRKTKENRREDTVVHSCPPRVLETRNIGYFSLLFFFPSA